MATPTLADTEFRSELQRILELLQRYLALQRNGGRSAATDPLRGLAIDEGEAEQLIAELAAQLAMTRPVSAELEPAIPELVLPAHAPFQHVRRSFKLKAVELSALVLALAVEVDLRFARIVAYLNDHISRTRPTIGLVLAITTSDLNAVEFCGLPAMRFGLLQVEGDGPLSGRALRVAAEFLPKLVATHSDAMPTMGVTVRAEDAFRIDDLLTGTDQRAKLKRWSSTLRTAATAPLVVAGAPGSGRATAVHAASSHAARPVVEIHWLADRIERAEILRIAIREALWQNATLLVRIPESVRESDMSGFFETLPPVNVPLAVTLAPELAEAACAASRVEPVLIQLEGTTVEQREALWTNLLTRGSPSPQARVSEEERNELAARYDFTPGALVRSVQRAAAEQGESVLDFVSLCRACRAIGSASMGPIAQRLPQPYTRSDLILPQELLNELDLAAAWMRNRRRVFEDWGFGRRLTLGRGLTALFSGESGTGKTMAAQVLAHDLGLELFRVDLSRTMSKYIGETEKNLSRLFDDARASGAILFFDEADAIFGKRTEVKDAHDRYANVEVGYLLQRMEEHTGTTVLATNRAGDLDEAFTRRFHFILTFSMPRPPERLRIWKGMLPAEAERDPGIELNQLSQDYEVSGGEIRNSVLSAAFMAAQEGVPIGLRHLKRGLRRELLKSGRVLDGRQRLALE